MTVTTEDAIAIIKQDIKEAVTTRLDPEDLEKLKAFVDSGLFDSLSEALRTLTQACLQILDSPELQNLEIIIHDHHERLEELLTEHATGALVSQVIEELATLLAAGQKRPIIDALARVRKMGERLPESTRDMFMTALAREPVYKLAERTVAS